MSFTPIDFRNPQAVPFLPDRGTTTRLNALQSILEFGRLIVEKTTSGKIRLKIGAGDRKYEQINYIGEGVISKDLIVTNPMGELVAGMNLKDKSFEEVAEMAFGAYQSFSFNSLSVSPNSLEIGQVLSGTINVTIGLSNPQNLAVGNSATISASPAIFTPRTFDPKNPLTITGVNTSSVVPQVVTITVSILGLRGETKTRTASINWFPRIWTGSSSLSSITTSSQVQALGSSRLSNTRQADYSFSGGYSYFFFPSFVSVTGIGFVDLDLVTNTELFPLDSTPISDVTITNAYGLSVVMKGFRSTYPFSGPTKTRVK